MNVTQKIHKENAREVRGEGREQRQQLYNNDPAKQEGNGDF